jgi:hypothetical protein
MKPGELIVLTETQKKGIEQADKERARLIAIVEEKHRKYPHQKRKK